jgi:hypothetical protein
VRPTFHSLLGPAWTALRRYWVPILLIQLLALAVLFSYYWVASAAPFFSLVARWQDQGGLLFAAFTTVISGGVLPECLKRFLRPAGEVGPTAGELVHQFAMWAIVGLLVHRFYRLQEQIFGSGADVWTLLPKVLFDQLVFAPLISLPFMAGWFLLYQHKFRPRPWANALRLPSLARRVLPLWMTSLSFWPIMLLIVYSLPGDLQFPLFLFANAAFSILMIFILRRPLET